MLDEIAKQLSASKKAADKRLPHASKGKRKKAFEVLYISLGGFISDNNNDANQIRGNNRGGGFR